MSNEQILRAFAGSFVLLSLALAHWVSPLWLWFTVFVGFNLLQSSFTGFCLLERGIVHVRTCRASKKPSIGA